MLSLKFIKENFDLVKKSTKSKNIDFDFEELLKNDDSRIELIQKVESLKFKRNKINKEIASKNNIEKNIELMREISKEIKLLDANLNEILKKINYDLLYIPNVIHNSVPLGNDEKDNIVIKEWGSKPNFNYPVRGQWRFVNHLS